MAEKMNLVLVFYETFPELKGNMRVLDWVQEHTRAAEGLIRVNQTGLRQQCIAMLSATGSLPEYICWHLQKVADVWDEGVKLLEGI